MARDLLVGRVTVSRATAALAVGDAIAIGAFVAIGELSHGRPILAGGEAFLQFAVGWAVAALLTGAYTGIAIARLRSAAVIGLGSWATGALIAQVIRAVMQPGFDIAPAFVVVSLLVGGGFVAGWRAVATVTFGGNDVIVAA